MKRQAIIYVRVSTDEQAEKGYSLKYQEERLLNYCNLNNIEVVDVVSEDYSAKTFDRPEWTRLLARLKAKSLKADLVLFTKWDRFSRNAPDAYTMIKKLTKLGLEPQAIEQPLDLSIPENKLMLAIFLTAPEVENDRRALNVIGGMRRAMKEGRWMNKAPLGYRNTFNEQNKKVIVPDKNAQLVKWMFMEMSKGTCNAYQVWKLARNRGLNCTKNTVWNLLRNPVYMGKVPIPASKDEAPYLAPGQHEAIISEELFYQVQDVLNGRRRNVPTKNTSREELPLRGFLICKRCGKLLTGSASKGNGGKYYYYHCQKGCAERFKAEQANQRLIEGLKELHSKPRAIEAYLLALKRAFAVNKQEHTSDKAVWQKELTKYKERLSTAQTMMLDREIEPADFREIKNRLEPEISRLERKINSTDTEKVNYGDYISGGINLISNLSEFFAGADLRAKQQLIGSIFPEKLIFENNQYRTTRFLTAFNRILALDATSSGKKRRTDTKILYQSSLVVPLGFEPRAAGLENLCSIQLSYGTVCKALKAAPKHGFESMQR